LAFDGGPFRMSGHLKNSVYIDKLYGYYNIIYGVLQR
jgi:hypothetical protein